MPNTSQVAHRFYNSHALANLAVSFRREAAGGDLSRVRVALGRYDTLDIGDAPAHPWNVLTIVWQQPASAFRFRLTYYKSNTQLPGFTGVLVPETGTDKELPLG